MKLSTRLYGGFGILLLLLVGTGLFSMRQSSLIHAETELLADDWLPSIVRLGQINDTLQTYRRYELVYILSTEDKEMSRYEGLMREQRARLDKAMAEYDLLITADQVEERREFTAFKSTLERYFAENAKTLKVAAINRDKAAEIASGDSARAVQEALAQLGRMIAFNVTSGERSADTAQALFSQSREKLLAALALAVAAGLGLAFLIARKVLGQLGEDPGYLQTVAADIAGGNLEVAFRPVRGRGGVYAVLISMVDTLKKKIAEAQAQTEVAALQAQAADEAARQAKEASLKAEGARNEGMLQAATRLEDVAAVISAASEELSSQVEQSSRGAEIQAGRLGETATAMEQMNATVLEVARNASQAAQTASQAREKAQEGEETVEGVVREISRVETQAVELKADMNALGAQAEAIGRVMNVISDIADQTNLLALNAAIEAARAGDAGRGFAVVADEVRKLAEKTMTATKEVGEAIRGIQEGARRNVDAVERTVDRVQAVTGMAGRSGESLHGIVELVERSTDQVRSIATASEEQSAASEEINRAIEDVSRISAETSRAMGQSARAVAELAAQAQALARLIGELKGESGDSPAAPRPLGVGRDEGRPALGGGRPALGSGRPATRTLH